MAAYPVLEVSADDATQPDPTHLAASLATGAGGVLVIQPGVSPERAYATFSTLARALETLPVPAPSPAPPSPPPPPPPTVPAVPAPPLPALPTKNPFPARASADTHKVYVSNQGADSNDGLSPEKPKRTIAMAAAQLRHGFPDWLLFKKGEVWNEPIGRWKKGGRSADEPMMIGTYGTGPRPLFETGPNTCFEVSPGAGTPVEINYLTMTGLAFYAQTRDIMHPSFNPAGGNGIRWVHIGHDIVIDDCFIGLFENNITFEGYATKKDPATGKDVFDETRAWLERVAIRNCVLVDSWSVADQHSQGVYATRVRQGLVIEDNYADHNGYMEGWEKVMAEKPALWPTIKSKPTTFNHNLYLQHNNGLDTIVRRNLLMRAASHGCQLRSGGLFEENFCYRNPIAFTGGYGAGLGTKVAGSKIDVRGNVVLDGMHNETPIPGDRGSGWGITFRELDSAKVMNNIVANIATSSPNRRSYEVYPWAVYGGNVAYNWPVPLGKGLGDTFDSSGPFKQPTWSPVMLAGSFEAFVKKVRAQSRDSFDQTITPAALCGLARAAFTAV